jgi:hypothetical protein
MTRKKTFEQLDFELNEGEKATTTIMYLSENKDLLKTKRGRKLLTDCLQIKQKWDEYEDLKIEMKLNNPDMSHEDYQVACMEIAERLGI